MESWEMFFFETQRGEKIVKEFIKSLSPEVISKIGREINLLQEHGPFLGMPYSKRLTKDLCELRIRGQQEIRIIYAFLDKAIYLLHVFIKKTQKTPQKEIKTAQQRLNTLTLI